MFSSRRKEFFILSDSKIIRDLTTGNAMKQLLIFSIPFILANLLQQLYNLADMVIVGQFVGSAGLAAASGGGELNMLFLFGAMGFSSGGQIVIAQHIGAGSKEEVRNTIGTMFTFLFGMGIVFMVVALTFCDRLILLLKMPSEALGYAHDYSIVYFCGMIPVFGYNAVSSILRGMGDSRHPFIFIAIAALTNVILDLIFVGPLKMACFGAALATVISQTLSFIIAIIFLYRHREEFGFDFKLKSFVIDKKELKSIARMGAPLAIMNMAVSVSMLIIARYINSYGVVASAATAVGNKITMVATICTSALMSSGNTIIGQNFAAKKYKRVEKIVAYILIIGLAFTGILAAILALFPEQVFGLFDQDPGVLELSHTYVLSGVISLFGFATRSAAFAFCNGIGNSRMSFIGGMIDGIVARIGLSLLFGIYCGMGIQGFWLGHAIAGNVIGFICLFYFFFANWKERKLLV